MLVHLLRIYCVDGCIIILYSNTQQDVNNKDLPKGPNRVPSPTRLRTETHPVSETLCFLVVRIPDDGHISKIQ
jgi:hypothetical protein